MTNKFDQLPEPVQRRWQERLPGDVGEILKIVVFSERAGMPFADVRKNPQFAGLKDGKIKKAVLSAASDLYEEKSGVIHRGPGFGRGTHKSLYTIALEELIGKAVEIKDKMPGAWEFYYRLACVATQPIVERMVAKDVDENLRKQVVHELMYADPTESRSENGQEPFSVAKTLSEWCVGKALSEWGIIGNLEIKIKNSIPAAINFLQNGETLTNQPWKNRIDPKTLPNREVPSDEGAAKIREIIEHAIRGDGKLFREKEKKALEIYLDGINTGFHKLNIAKKIATDLEISNNTAKQLLNSIDRKIMLSFSEIPIDDRRKSRGE